MLRQDREGLQHRKRCLAVKLRFELKLNLILALFGHSLPRYLIIQDGTQRLPPWTA